MIESEPMSVTVVEIREYKSLIECRASNEAGAKCSEYQEPEYVMGFTKNMQNIKIEVGFDQETKFLNFLYLKDLKIKVEIEMQLVRYSGVKSESGAYIFAPS